MVQLSQLYMTTGKTIALTIWTFVCKMMSLFFNIFSRFVTAFFPRNKHLLIIWLQLLSTMILVCLFSRNVKLKNNGLDPIYPIEYCYSCSSIKAWYFINQITTQKYKMHEGLKILNIKLSKTKGQVIYHSLV